jgi:hypothetical protein
MAESPLNVPYFKILTRLELDFNSPKPIISALNFPIYDFPQFKIKFYLKIPQT